MQTWFIYFDVRRSARSLDQKRLGAQIYEGIHILSSLLNYNDKLFNPKRSVKNHPVSQRWMGYENELFNYIVIHLREWQERGYKSAVNLRNMYNIMAEFPGRFKGYESCPHWVDIDMIREHRGKLLERLPEHYKKVFLDNPDY